MKRNPKMATIVIAQSIKRSTTAILFSRSSEKVRLSTVFSSSNIHLFRQFSHNFCTKPSEDFFDYLGPLNEWARGHFLSTKSFLGSLDASSEWKMCFLSNMYSLMLYGVWSVNATYFESIRCTFLNGNTLSMEFCQLIVVYGLHISIGYC